MIICCHFKFRIKKAKDIENEVDELKSLKDTISDAERKAIERTILYYKGDKKAAMNSLKIAKSSFYEKLKKYNLSNFSEM